MMKFSLELSRDIPDVYLENLEDLIDMIMESCERYEASMKVNALVKCLTMQICACEQPELLLQYVQQSLDIHVPMFKQVLGPQGEPDSSDDL